MKQDQQPTPTNYKEALEALGKYRSRKIANNTYLEHYVSSVLDERIDVVVVRLHATHIVTFYANSTTELNSGGQRTSTTKERMNRFLPFNGIGVWQENFEWVYYNQNTGEKLKFYDGMTIDSMTGKVLRPFNLSENDKPK